jgi:hypothetical protein
VAGLPDDARVVLGTHPDGRCVFLETARGNRCAIHRQLRPGHLASACRDFPRIVTLSPLGVSITLSHYCPTAAGLVLREDRRLAIDADPPAFPRSWPYEGLDARKSFGPLLRPGVLMGWDAHARWEGHAVATLGREDLPPESSVGLLATQAEAARRWTPADGPFDAHLDRVLASDPVHDTDLRTDAAESGRAWRLVAQCVPRGHPVPQPPPPPSGAGVPDLPPGPVRRWLAAKAFASWLALQGEGLRTTVLGLRLALAVLGAETERERPPGPEGLREVFRRADLLLVHLVDPTALARRLSGVERVADPLPRPW